MQDLLFTRVVPETELVPARPFLKWAGGKTQILGEIASLLPASLTSGEVEFEGQYIEPFVGSGALFFRIRPNLEAPRAHLSDVNGELIVTYIAIRDHLELVLELLKVHEHEHNVASSGQREYRHDYYTKIRKLDRDRHWHADANSAPSTLALHAARFIYLNRTCFNGLWRVNQKGHFNVPLGAYKNPRILNESLLRRASKALQGVDIAKQPYKSAVSLVQKGDIVYFDPPYMPISVTSSFNAYAKDAFLTKEHLELAATFLDLSCKGVKVVLSNSDTPFTALPFGPKGDLAAFKSAFAEPARELGLTRSFEEYYEAYVQDWNVTRVSATRAINSRASQRGAVSELLVTNRN